MGDVRDLESLQRACDGIDAMFHLAAGAGVVDSIENPIENFDLNARGTLLALWAAKQAGVGRFVFSSSNAPLGDNAYPASRGQAGGAAVAVRRRQGHRRGLLLGLLRRLRLRRGGGAVLERVRPALGAQVERDPAVHPQDHGGRAADDLRRRHPDPRLRVRDRSRQRPDPGGRDAGRGRRDLPAGERRRDQPQRPGGDAGGGVGQRSRELRTSRPGPARSSATTRWSTRPATGSGMPRRCRWPRGWRAPGSWFQEQTAG